MQSKTKSQLLGIMQKLTNNGRILLVEPFYGGSHKQLIDLLHDHFTGSVKVTLKAKKWHWRARTSALYLSQEIPFSKCYRVLFTSGVLNLAELVALRPDLSGLKKILYFHENQLVYPVQDEKHRDFQFGYNQILSCLVADIVAFNSFYNMNSFLYTINTFLNKMPDCRPKQLADKIRPKCCVLHFPLNLPSQEHTSCTLSSGSINTQKLDHTYFKQEINTVLKDEYGNCHDALKGDNSDTDARIEDDHGSSMTCNVKKIYEKKHKTGPLHIVWAHRWEHDKDPETFFKTMFKLQDDGVDFRLSVMGEQFTDNPEIFSVAKERLAQHIEVWGYQEDKEKFYKILSEADVAVSTALHEFFGVSMLEAVYYGCYPLCPNRLVYPEIFPKPYLYNTPAQLFKKLRRFCLVPNDVRCATMQVPIDKYLWENCAQKFYDLFEVGDHVAD